MNLMKKRTREGDRFQLVKSSDEKRQVFGWASVSVEVDGEKVVDSQNDIIEIQELEDAVYLYVAESGSAGEMHQKSQVGQLIESVVFTEEKAEAMGLTQKVLPQGWWVGFQIHDNKVWEKVKNGTYTMFSIEGTAQRENTDHSPTSPQSQEDLESTEDPSRTTHEDLESPKKKP